MPSVLSIENKLAGWQGEKSALDAKLADPALYAEGHSEEMQALHRRQAELAQSIDEAELRWLEVHELLEALAD